MRKLLMLPALVSLILSIIFIVQGDFVRFFLWLFAAFIFFFIFWPLVGPVTEVHAPILHVFGTMFAFIVLFMLVAYRDLIQAGFTQIEAFGYAIVIGIAGIAIVMALKGGK